MDRALIFSAITARGAVWPARRDQAFACAQGSDPATYWDSNEDLAAALEINILRHYVKEKKMEALISWFSERLTATLSATRSMLRFSKQPTQRANKPPKPSDRDFVLPKITRLDPVPYYLAIVAIVKNEAAYLEEWLDFHCLVGCSHFYIYDNGSTDGTVEILRRYERNGVVTPIPWPDFMPWSTLIHHCTSQLPAYAHAISAFGKFSRWMMFIDADEFVFPADGDDLKQELAAFEDLPALALPWHMFGPSGHGKAPRGFVIENYTQRAALPPVYKRLIKTKSVVDPTRVRVPGAHRCILDEGRLVFTQSRQIVRDPNWKYIAPLNDDRIILNHYFAKSIEEAACRGAALASDWHTLEASVARRLKLVKLIESALVEDRRIQRFLPKLKALRDTEQRHIN